MKHKPYFTKYLPVEGEIFKGDYFYDKDWDNVYKSVSPSRTSTYIVDSKNGFHERIMCKKVKLFLCSRDIQVGNEVIYLPSGEKRKVLSKEEVESLTGKGKGNWCEFKVAKDERFHIKVIGEVSSEATWVKEGMEFDETQVKIRFTDMHGKLINSYRDIRRSSDINWKYAKVAILCSCCSKFS